MGAHPWPDAVTCLRTLRWLILGLAVSACVPAPSTPAPPPLPTSLPGVTETLLATINYETWVGDTFVVSPDGRRIAYAQRRSDGHVMYLDGEPFGPYDGVQQMPPVFAPDSSSLAFGVEVGDDRYMVAGELRFGPYEEVGVPVFASGGRGFAFKFRRDGLESVSVSGEIQAAFDQVDNPHLSPNGDRLIYSARRQAEWFAVVDGIEGPAYDDVFIPADPFSPDGSKYVYLAVEGSDWYVQTESGSHGPFAAIAQRSAVFSNDGTRMAFVGQRDVRWQVVVDGRPSRLYDVVTPPIFSNDSQHVAYAGGWGGRSYIVFDDETFGPYDAISAVGGLAHAPHGRRFAHAAQIGSEWFIVADGVRGPSFDAVGPPVFSPDGSGLAYIGLRGEEWFVIVDGEEQGPFVSVLAESLTFSAGGEHLAFVVQAGPFQLVVLDGERGKAYDSILANSLVFGPEGGPLAYAASEGEARFVVVGGAEGPPFEAVIAGRQTPIIFDSRTRLHYLGVRGSEVFLVEVDAQE
jgi:hypothetical protein